LTQQNEEFDPGPWLGLPLGKTEAGRREITARALPLSRSARNLLLIIDASRSVGQWLALVRGCGPDELQQLLEAGLVGVVSAAGGAAAPGAPAPSAAPAAGAAEAPRTTARMGLADALQTLGYQVLYDRLTAAARQQLGLFKGYKLILDIEKCAGPPELRSLALQFIEQVRLTKGDAEARVLAQRLVDPG
jgi:hypothetical protein